jgi:hypothetical protein
MRNLLLATPFLTSLLCLATASCGGDDAATSFRAPGNNLSSTSSTSGGDSVTGAGGGFGGGAGGAGGGPPTPPEMEVEKAFEAPVATERFVWAANPKTGRVALIDSKNFQVTTVAAGQGPTFIAAIPGKDDRAIVLNVLSNDATYLSQLPDGTLDRKTFQIAPRANAWAISPDGHFAIAWTDVTRVQNPDSIEGFQQITVIDMTTTAAISSAPVRTVGFRPSSISFATDGSRAFAVTEDGITVIDLSTPSDPQITKTIKLDSSTATPAFTDSGIDNADAGTIGPDGASAEAAGSDAGPDASSPDAPGADASAPPPVPPPTGKADVSITPSGGYAVVRRDGSPVVTVIDLIDGSRWSWTLSGPVTDLDLSDTGDRAVAVVRSASRVAILPVPGMPSGPFDDVLIDGETVGSVALAPKGTTALLYTNAVAKSRLTILQLASSPTYRVVDLHAPLLSVFPSPTAEHALVIHNSFMGQAFQSPGAFSIVPLAGEQAAVIQPTDAPPLSVAISPAGDRALVPVRDDSKGIYGVYVAQMPSLVTERFTLASPPSAAGFVGSAGQAFVAQEHPEGRVTFIDSTSGLVRTITGFELGASVVVWSRDGGQ